MEIATLERDSVTRVTVKLPSAEVGYRPPPPRRSERRATASIFVLPIARRVLRAALARRNWKQGRTDCRAPCASPSRAFSCGCRLGRPGSSRPPGELLEMRGAAAGLLGRQRCCGLCTWRWSRRCAPAGRIRLSPGIACSRDVGGTRKWLRTFSSERPSAPECLRFSN